MSRTLLAIGPGRLPNDWQRRLAKLLGRHESADGELDVLAFRDDPDDAIISYIRSIWKGTVRELSGADYFGKVDNRVNASISEFVADLRNRLTNAAMSASGKRWASRFGRLWWGTVISEKNTPADDMWWQLFRAAAVKECMDEREYSRSVLMGDNWFVGICGQVANQLGVPSEGLSIRTNAFSPLRVILTRLAGGLFYFLAAIMAKQYERSREQSQIDAAAIPPSPNYLIHTFFPRMWTDRFDSWRDTYYGTLPHILKDKSDANPIYSLRLYDSTAFIHPSLYKQRLSVLASPEKSPCNYLLLESFAGLLNILRSYLSPSDAINFYKTTRRTEFQRAFVWEDLNVREMFENRLWRSALVNWPHLNVLESSVSKLSKHVRPDVVISYCFEFIHGRAIINGTRRGAPAAKIIGLQHGPISPMKMLYSGVESELEHSENSGECMPEPDVYSVDGRIASGILQGSGIPSAKIRTPGAARLDDVWAGSRRVSRADRRDGKLRILIAPGLHDTPFLLGVALKALSDDPRLGLVLKPHPKVPPQYVANLMSSYSQSVGGRGAEINLVKQGSIYEWMSQSDIFLATYSSVGVEAIAFGLPVILMLPNSTPDMSLCHSQRAPVLKASNAAELKEHVNMLVSSPETIAQYTAQLQDILRDSFGPIDSEASYRLARLCEEVWHSRTAGKANEIEAVEAPTLTS